MRLSLAFLLYVMAASSIFAASLRAPWDITNVFVILALGALGVAVADMVNVSKPPAELIAFAEALVAGLIFAIASVLLFGSHS